MKITVTKKVDYYVAFQHLRTDDPDDGQSAGWYAWVATAPDSQSDFVYGPYETQEAAADNVAKRLRDKL